MNDTRVFTRVELDAQPVRYSYRQPSMSRRGGIKLHPIKDGTLPMGELRPRMRDRTGQKLTDVIDPHTGFCVGVRSNIESAANRTPATPDAPGVAGTHTVATRRADVSKHNSGLYLDCETGVVVRTCDMGDALIPLRPKSIPSTTTKPQKERAVRKSSPRPSTTPGATGAGGRVTRSDCEALIMALAAKRGQQPPAKITPSMMNAARVFLVEQGKKAREQLGG